MIAIIIFSSLVYIAIGFFIICYISSSRIDIKDVIMGVLWPIFLVLIFVIVIIIYIYKFVIFILKIISREER